MTMTSPQSSGFGNMPRLARQAALALIGFLLAWFVVGEVWVNFDSFVPTAISMGLLAAAGTLGFYRLRKMRGLGIGLVVGASLAGVIFFMLSIGPKIP